MKGEVLLEIGQALKKKRLSARLSLVQLSKDLKIRKIYLRAIETGNIKVLKFDAYMIGYIKQYSIALGIDPTLYIESITHSVKPRKMQPIASKNLITGKEFLPSRKIILAVTSLLVAMYIFVEIFV